MIQNIFILILPFLLLMIGLFLLTKGADLVIEGSINAAKKFNVSTLLIGLTIIALGTSLPELVASVQAVLNNAPGLALGNIIGSNIANILLILGVGSLISPIIIKKEQFKVDGYFLFLSTLFFSLLIYFNLLEYKYGYPMIGLLISFLIIDYLRAKKFGEDKISLVDVSELKNKNTSSVQIILLKIIIGLTILIFGAEILVSNAIKIAKTLEVSEEIIGLTMVAIGTSLPELATVIVAAKKQETDLIIGNVIGSNIFNILGVIGVTSIITNIPVSANILKLDLWIMIFITSVFIFFIFNMYYIKRIVGLIFLILYIFYIVVCFL